METWVECASMDPRPSMPPTGHGCRTWLPRLTSLRRARKPTLSSSVAKVVLFAVVSIKKSCLRATLPANGLPPGKKASQDWPTLTPSPLPLSRVTVLVVGCKLPWHATYELPQPMLYSAFLLLEKDSSPPWVTCGSPGSLELDLLNNSVS